MNNKMKITIILVVIIIFLIGFYFIKNSKENSENFNFEIYFLTQVKQIVF